MAEQIEEADAESTGGLAATGASAAAALAIGLRRANDKDQADPKLDAFLDEQTELIRLQKEHLHEQRMLVLSRLRWGRFSDRMKALLQIMTAVVGVGVAIGVGGLAWSASQEHGLVIQPFSAPPDLEQKGLNGQVVASMLLDKLGQMQDATTSIRAKASYANNWNDEIKVEIPETGVSIGELRRLLVRWLGRQTSISGEVYHTPTGLALAARAGTAAAKVHTGTEADLDSMVQQAAEDVYARTQPYRYAIYVAGDETDPAKVARAKDLLEKLVASGDRVDRIWALAALANERQRLGDFPGALRDSGRSIALDPDFPLSYLDRADIEGVLGHDEAGLADQRAGFSAMQRAGAHYLNRTQMSRDLLSDEAGLQSDLGDYARAARNLAKANELIPGGALEDMNLAEYQAQAHDIAAARATAVEMQSATALGNLSPLMQAFVGGFLAFDLDNWAEARRQFKIAYDGLSAPGMLPEYRSEAPDIVGPNLAIAMARMGDISAAQALLAMSGLDCYSCVWARGDVAARAGDAAGADRWFAEAVRQAPSIPFAYEDWAQAKLDRGDIDGAVALLATALGKAPHFANANELWGEALMKRRDFAGAAAKFAAADQDTPAWGRNHLKWGEALMLAGRYAEARRQFEAADGLELSVGDGAALKVLLARTASGPLHG